MTVAILSLVAGVAAAQKTPPAVRRVPHRVPAESELTDTAMRASVRRGRALVHDTRDSLPANVGSRLQCVSCHADDGTRKNAMSWIGVYARYPQYRSRSGTVQLIEDRIDDCFLRSLNGRVLPRSGRDMRDIVNYMAFLSLGVPVGHEVEGQGLPKMAVLVPDTTRGRGVYVAQCARCHGAGGQGIPPAPPVWGRESFNIGAGTARLRTAASFIRHVMPQDKPGTLTDQQAFDVAGFIVSRPRPDFARKALDWPNGDPPPDAAYPTMAAAKKKMK